MSGEGGDGSLAEDRPLLGLIGGMSWRSSADYYARLNREMERRAGAHRNPPILLTSVRFEPLLDAAQADRWPSVEQRMVTEGRRLVAGGCTAVALTAVSAHRCHASLADALDVPVPHVFDAVAAWLDTLLIERAGILATGFSLGGDVCRRLGRDRELVVPSADDQRAIDAMIAQRLTAGVLVAADRAALARIIADLHHRGAEAVVMACTELPLLQPVPTPARCPLVDAVALHVAALCDLVADRP